MHNGYMIILAEYKLLLFSRTIILLQSTYLFDMNYFTGNQTN